MDTPSKDLDLDNTTAIEHNKYLSHDKQPVGPPRLRFTTVYDYSKTAVVVKTLHDEADPGVIDRPLLRRESPELQVGLRDLLMERERHINAKIRKRRKRWTTDIAVRPQLPQGKRLNYWRVQRHKPCPALVPMDKRWTMPPRWRRSQEAALTVNDRKDTSMSGMRADVPGMPRAGAATKSLS